MEAQKNWFYFIIFISELFLSHDDMEKLHDFEEECAEDYFREKDIQLQSSSDKRIQVINERFVLMAGRLIYPHC